MQSAEFENGQPVKLRIPDKIAAVKELTKMCGWAQPNRIELSARDTLADFIDSNPPGTAPARHVGLRGRQRGAHRHLEEHLLPGTLRTLPDESPVVFSRPWQVQPVAVHYLFA